jgi:hypothetical protein
LLAQEDSSLSNWRTKTLIIKKSKPFQLDSLPVIPHTLEIFDTNTGERIADKYYDFNYGKLTWKRTSLPDTIDLRYEILTVDLTKKFSRLDTNYIKVDPTLPPNYIFDPFAKDDSNKDILNLKGVEYSGSFARGISFGNSQNLVLNSSFNLQMAGTLGDDIEILAAISDQNIPLQPEGNTQNIQDFDRVFIQVKKDRTSLIAGDFDLRKPPGYFMNYNKKLQGVKLENISNLFGGEWKNSGAFAISGGKFARQTLTAVEGNQGPYKLRGNENELFIIVLSGTEKVYFDGILLERGEINDYTVDYNRGEVIFTTNRLITKDSRIIVEFEYTDQNYLRFLYTLGSEYKKGKWSGRLNFYNEQDSKTSSGQQELTTAQIEFLTGAGDSFEGTFAPGIDTLEEFTTDRITYAQIDTVANGFLYQDILIYNTNSDSAKYTARFTEIGQNLGNYILSASAANGRVYAWVAPDPATGQLQGNFEPVVSIIAPQKRQLLTLGGRYEINKKSYVDIEGAMSINDRNRFSKVDANDDRGTSLRVDYRQSYDLKKKDIAESDEDKNKTSDWQLSTNAGYEFKQKNFQALSPYRAAEFTRDWNISNVDILDEHLAVAGFDIKKNRLGQISYDFGTFLRDTSYQGFKHSFSSLINQKGFRILAKGSYLQTETTTEKTSFFRPNAEISKTFTKLGGLKIGTTGMREKNSRFDIANDSLQSNSFFFDILGTYFETTTSNKTKLGGRYSRRWDYAAAENEFSNSTIADEVNINGQWNASKASRLKWNMTYRNLKIVNEELTTEESLGTYLGRLEHSLKLFKGALRSSTIYEIGSGQEPELEFVYQKVNPGEGIYTWLDRNLDSIPQLDEFEIAIFQDQADYIRVGTLTDRYIRSNLVQFNNNLYLEPKAIWFKETKNFKALLSKLAIQSTVKINRKVRLDDNVSQWNPFDLAVPDSSLVSLGSIYRATLYFNRSNPKYDARIGINHVNNRRVLTTGYESKGNQERFIASRWNITKKWSTNLQFSEGWRLSDSEFFDNKDYRIRYYKIEPRLTFQPSKNFRVIQAYKYEQGNNKIGDIESITKHDANMEITFNQSSKTSIRSKISFVSVQYEGEVNTPVSFTMLEGLQDGLNYLWNITFDRKLSRNLLLSLSYDGRKTGEAKVVHVGRASIRATF